MSTHHTDIILKKLYYIHTICADSKKKEKPQGEKKDSFKGQKDKIAAELRQAKQLVAERDALLATASSQAIVAGVTHSIHSHIKTAKTDIELLRRMQQKKADKYEGKNEIKEETRFRLEREKEIVQIANKNLQKVIDLERFGKYGNPHQEELEDSEYEKDNEGVVVQIPDLEDVDFKQMNATNNLIDEDLEKMLLDIEIIKQMAIEMGVEMAKQEDVMVQMEVQTEKTSATLRTLNSRLTQLIKSQGSPSEWCCYIFLIILILGIAAAIIFLAVGS